MNRLGSNGMSVSKVHIARFSGAAAENLFQILQSNSQRGDHPKGFCERFATELNSGMCNDYVTLWDNYSVGGDQLEYVFDTFSDRAESFGKWMGWPWGITFGFNFSTPKSKGLPREPADKMHRMIFYNVFKAMEPSAGHLVVCMAQALGPTISDADLEERQKCFFGNGIIGTDH